ncbi:MAG: aryl-sulfate sulfotransferase [Cyclobacteriaceae bacterium]
MKSTGLLFLFTGLILFGCENGDDLHALRTELTLAEIKLALATSKNDNNLITKIDSDNQITTIHFETGAPIVMQTHWIQATVYDSANWLATFQLRDGSDQWANFVGELDFDEDDIVLNPYLTSPLTALADIETPVNGKFKVFIKGKSPKGVTVEKSFDYFGDEHELPVLGLYEDYANQVEFVFMNIDNKVRCSKIVVLRTAPVENKPPLEIEVFNNQLSEAYTGLYVISNLRVGFDQTGETRWYYNLRGMFFDKLTNGNFIVGDPSSQSFSEVTMLGQLVKRYEVPNALHHEIFEMPAGNFLVASHSPPGAPFEDVVVEISRVSGQVIKSWDFNTILDPSRRTLPNTQSGDWLHINALYYDESDNSIVISGRSQCAVVKIDYATSAIKWILSNHNYWDPPFTSFLLKPVNSQGNEMDISDIDFWSYGQHAIHRLPNANLLLYDNGDYRGFYDNPNVPQNSYTRIAEYKINEQQMTVELVWHFDHNRDVFTKFTGYTQDLEDTRLAAYMFASENTPKIVEVNTNNQVVYEATINRGKASYYRTLKLDVYSGLD